MLKEPTVLVLGAGASVGFGLPIGAKLAKAIREALSYEWDLELTRGDRTLLDDARTAEVEAQAFLDGARKIAAALHASSQLTTAFTATAITRWAFSPTRWRLRARSRWRSGRASLQGFGAREGTA